MKTITRTTHRCEICGEEYADVSRALDCESVPVLQDKGAKIGSRVRILNGDGAGQEAIVESLSVHTPSWGPSKYSHTRCVTAKLVNSWGHRSLTFDAYELI